MNFDAGPLTTWAAVAAALMYLSKSVWELVRERRSETAQTGNGEGYASRVATAVASTMRQHSDSEERILSKLVDLQSSGLVALTRIETQLAVLAENARSQAMRMEAINDNVQRRAHG